MTDRSSIGFRLTKTPSARALGGVPPLMRFDINIARGDPNHRIDPVVYTLPRAADSISLTPHVHMRGSGAKFEAFFPERAPE